MSFTISANSMSLNRGNAPAGVFFSYRWLGWLYITSQPRNHDCAALFMGTRNDPQGLSIALKQPVRASETFRPQHSTCAWLKIAPAPPCWPWNLRTQNLRFSQSPFIFDLLWTRNVARLDSTSDCLQQLRSGFLKQQINTYFPENVQLRVPVTPPASRYIRAPKISSHSEQSQKLSSSYNPVDPVGGGGHHNRH